MIIRLYELAMLLVVEFCLFHICDGTCVYMHRFKNDVKAHMHMQHAYIHKCMHMRKHMHKHMHKHNTCSKNMQHAQTPQCSSTQHMHICTQHTTHAHMHMHHVYMPSNFDLKGFKCFSADFQ